MTRAKATPEIVTVHVPFRLVKRGGRKEMQLPPGTDAQRPSVDSTLIKALARAFRWKRMLESGEFTTIAELAAHEKLAPSYMTRVLRMSLLAPDIVEAIMDGRQDAEVSLARLLEPFSLDWSHQAGNFEQWQIVANRPILPSDMTPTPQCGCELADIAPDRSARAHRSSASA